MKGILYVVATPIGNLGDITLRAIEVLKQVDLIACEDTRHTKILLSHYGIKKTLTSYFEHNKQKKAKYILELLKKGKKIALVSDAGTPGISDPGYRVIRDVIDNGIEVISIPGTNAAIAALAVSGMPTDRFMFEGFLPNKTTARKKALSALLDIKKTIIYYESPHRLLASLQDIKDVLGDIELVIAREITKKFEEIRRGSAGELLSYFKQCKVRGEFVIIINLKKVATGK
jgi:16S rRNA (cytidine1402-2'-O)-methyltransferase